MSDTPHEDRVEGSTPDADQLAGGPSGVAGETASKRVEPSMPPSCDCDPAKAWAWVATVTEDALAGDRLSKRLLPRVMSHALWVERTRA